MITLLEIQIFSITKSINKQLTYILLNILIILGLLLCTLPNPVDADDDTTPPVAGQQVSYSGWFSIIWGDSEDGKSSVIYTLTDIKGKRILLQIDEEIAKQLGGVLQFNKKYVTVTGTWVPSVKSDTARDERAVIKLISITEIPPPDSRLKTKKIMVRGVSGSHPWITLMCKFSDIAAEPHDRDYFLGMYGDSKPGLNHYWKELSFNTVDIAGSTVAGTGWYTLPNPESYYNPTDTSGGADKTLLAQDCIAAADADVDYSLYSGINMMFNSNFDNGWAWGGGWYDTLDGVTQNWSITWEPPWGYNTISVIAHEMGHGFGLPHSTAIDWTSVYDNAWDVMSWDRYNCAAATDATYGCMAQHTISSYKDLLDWIPNERKLTVGLNTLTTVIVEDLAAPASDNFQMVKIPIGGSNTHFYTVETRRFTGYDVKLPAEGVIIHEVEGTAVLVPNTLSSTDPGVVWTVGEKFIDLINQVSVEVKSATATGFVLKISNQKLLDIPPVVAVCQWWCPIWIDPWQWIINPVVIVSLILLPVLAWAIGRNFQTAQRQRAGIIAAAIGFAVVAVNGPIGAWLVIGSTTIAAGRVLLATK